MFNYHSLIPWGSFRGRQEEKWGSFRGRFGDHFRVGDHFGVGIISGAVHFSDLVMNEWEVAVYFETAFDTHKFTVNREAHISHVVSFDSLLFKGIVSQTAHVQVIN